MNSDSNENTLENIYSSNERIISNQKVEYWKELLNYQENKESNTLLNLKLDLQEQDKIKNDSRNFSETSFLPGNDPSEVAQDIEGIVTCYCKTKGIIYTSDIGLVETASIFVTMECNMNEIYQMFNLFRNKFILNNTFNDKIIYQLFRVLLTYHDPYICSFLDTKKIHPDSYSNYWLHTLFASTCSRNVILKLWELYFSEDDVFLIFFLMMVLILNSRDSLLERALCTNRELIDYIVVLPQQIGIEDSEDMINLAKFYKTKTPKSFYKQCQAHILGNIILTGIPLPVLCLEILATELVSSYSMNDSINFFTVDCRPLNEFKNGHLPNSFNLNVTLLLENKEEFNKCLQDLFQKHRFLLEQNSQSCEHICFLTSTDNEEDHMLVNMVVSLFIQRRVSFVSIVRGGFTNVHDLLVNGDSSYGLINHNSLDCCLCSRNSSKMIMNLVDKPFSDQKSITGKIFDSLKITKQKIDQLVNNSKMPIKHVSSQDKNTYNRYMGSKGVFRIDDELEENSFECNQKNISKSNIENNKNVDDTINDEKLSISSNSSFKSSGSNNRNELVQVSSLKVDKATIAFYVCTELIQVSGELMPSFVVLKSDEIVILRQINNNLQWAKVVSTIPLQNIARITCNRSNSHLISFHIENVTQNSFTKRLFHFSDGKSVVRQITSVIESSES